MKRRERTRRTREEQKAARERRILRAAEDLFGRRGYAETTMGEIAQRAGLAVGTIYNYFASKPEIVLALLHRETGITLAAGEAVVKRPPDDPAEAVAALFDVYVDLVLRHDRGQLRELLAAAMAQPDPIARGALELDLRLIAQLTELLRDLAARGRLRPGLDAGRGALTLYGVYASWMVVYAASDVPAASFRDEVRRGVAIAVRGLAAPPPAAAR
jgi:AcrR family transcriptional regulator